MILGGKTWNDPRQKDVGPLDLPLPCAMLTSEELTRQAASERRQRGHGGEPARQGKESHGAVLADPQLRGLQHGLLAKYTEIIGNFITIDRLPVAL